MKKGLRLVLTLITLFLIAGMTMAAERDGKKSIKSFTFEKNGFRHSMSVINEDVTGKKAVVDTIQHFFTGTPSTDWDTGIATYAIAGDTLCNWFDFLADSAEVMGIMASFATPGNGSWNLWPADPTNTYYPQTQFGQLFFDVPWSITTADVDGAGAATGTFQTLDLVGQGLNTTIVADGIYCGFYYDATVNPLSFMDAGGHPRNDQPGYDGWEYAKHFLGSQSNATWYFWATSTTWTEFTIKLIVQYTAVAPFSKNISGPTDYFAGNDVIDMTVSADITDLDGTVASANLKYQVRGQSIVQSAAMTAGTGDSWSGTFGSTFAAGDTVDYWIEATDDGGNVGMSASSDFAVVAPPASGTDVLIVADGAGGREGAFESALGTMSKSFYTWDVNAHGGISSYEVNYGFGTVIWTGFGTSSSPSPYGADASGVASFMDAGGNFIIADMDYLFIHGWPDASVGYDSLAAGDFAYDYLGLEKAYSDPVLGDSVYFGFPADPISGSWATTGMTVSPIAGGGSDDWSDITIGMSSTNDLFYNNSSTGFGYNAGTSYSNGTFLSAFLPFPLETAGATDLETFLNNFFLTAATGIDEDGNTVLNSYELHQNYPNPFNPTTNIAFSLQKAGQVNLTVFNALGQEVVTLVDQDMTAGAHTINWNGRDASGAQVATGVYVYKIKAGDFTSQRKMLLVK